MAEHPLTKGAPGFYVYEIVVDGLIRYIGKGCGERAKEHLRTARRIQKIRALGQRHRTTRFYNRLVNALARKASIEVRVMAVFDFEGEALEAEIAAIAGAPAGQLWNTFPGGEGFTSEWIKALWADPKYRDRRAQAAREMWEDPEFRREWSARRADPEHRAHMSAALTKALADPVVRKKMSDRKREAYATDPAARDRMEAALAKARANPDVARKTSERLNEMWADPERRAAHVEKYKRAWSDPELRARKSELTKLQFTQDARLRASETQKALWKDPTYRAAQLAKLKSPEAVAKRSAARMECFKDPAWREKFGEAIRRGKAAARKAKCST